MTGLSAEKNCASFTFKIMRLWSASAKEKPKPKTGHLDAINQTAYASLRSEGRAVAPMQMGEESPGSMETRRRITSGGGDSRESATESKPPASYFMGEVRVKGCGKSAPRGR